MSVKTIEESISNSAPIKNPPEKSAKEYKWDILWVNVVVYVYIHTAALYGLLCLPVVKYWTVLWTFTVGLASILGITAGVHRLWSHRSYKAKWPLRLLLMIFQTVAFQDDIYHWARDHRVHHKFTDTDADPYNARRGFFFSHMGWLLMRKHPDVIKKGATVDCSDLKQDPFVMFQKKYYYYLMPVLCFIVPTLVPWWLWNESLWYSWHIAVARYCINLHITWLVNSAAHIWGMRPYDKSITPAENVTVAFLAGGEGWHNYHHVFPWDYKAAELGNYTLNFTTAFIDFFAFLGWAYDMKTASSDMVKKRILRNNKETVNNECTTYIN